MVVVVGEALTEAPVVALNPDEGAQEYEAAPPAVKIVDDPLHIVVEGDNVIVGVGTTDTVITRMSEHPPPFVPDIV